MPTTGQGRNVHFYVGSTNRVAISGLHLAEDEDEDGNVADEDYLNDATVTIETLTDAAGAPVTGVTLPIVMTYDDDPEPTNGNYSGNFADTAVMAVGTPEYRCVVKVVAATGEVGRFKMQGPAVYAGG